MTGMMMAMMAITPKVTIWMTTMMTTTATHGKSSRSGLLR